MKKIVGLVVALFALLTLSTNAVAQQVGGGAKIDFKKETHDYGNIKYGANGECTFEFTNTGSAPLIISDAKGSCGCTVPNGRKNQLLLVQKVQLK